MKDFTFHIPTKIIFGKETVSQVGDIAKAFGKRALLVYGKSSIKRNGVYDTVIGSLKNAGLDWVEHKGVKSNPLLSHAEEGVRIAKKEKVDFVLPVGGGSVIDESKAIAAGAVTDGRIWDFFTGERTVERALPVVTVLTIPATSSEMNSTSVLTNDRTFDKVGFSSPHLSPQVSVLDPTVTYTIPKEYTAYSGIDIISHLIEGYFTHKDPWVPIQDGFVEVLVHAVIESTEKCLSNPKDYQGRATMMWAGSLAWSGFYVAGIGDMQVPNHLLEHPLSALYDIAHGAGLSIIIPAWMRYASRKDSTKFARFAHAIFDIDSGSDADDAVKGIEALSAWFKKLGSPVSFEEANIPSEDIDRIAERAVVLAGIWKHNNYTKTIIKQIYSMCA
jgi:alcohol dehydrogenase YqhD (iron-dependent ADH family)